MELYIRLQVETVCAGFALGAAAALLYDLLRTVRMARHARLMTHLTDLAYVALVGWALLRFTLSIGQGELRLYVLPCAVLGGAGYLRFLAPILRPLWRFWGGAAAQFLRWLWKPIDAMLQVFKKIRGKPKKMIYFLKKSCKMKVSVWRRRKRQEANNP